VQPVATIFPLCPNRTNLLELDLLAGYPRAVERGDWGRTTATIENFPIGREQEARLLSETLDAVVGGTKHAVVLSGEPGVGKTTLMRWLAERAAKIGAVSASARAPASAGLPPTFPIGDLIAGLRRACLRQQKDEPDSLIDLDLRLSKGGAADATGVLPLAACVSDLLERAPVALFIDDAHWVPPQAVEALAGVLHLCDGPLLVAATSRTRPRAQTPAAFADLGGDVTRVQISVEPMDCDGIAAFSEEALGAPLIPSTTAALHRASRGLPLEAAEIIRAWRAAGTLHAAGGYWVADEAATLPHADLFSSRVMALDDEARRLVEMMAVIGTASGFDHLREVLGADPVDLARLLADLTDDGIVAASEGRLAFSLAHPLYDACVLEMLGSTRKAALHLQAHAGLARLRANGESIPAPVLAHHAVSAISRPAGLRELLAEAAEASEAGNAREHARWLGELERLEEPGPARVDAALRRAEATLAFDPAAAHNLFDALAAGAHADHVRARCLVGLAKAERRLGRLERAVAEATEAAALAPNDGGALGTLALMLGVSGDLAGSGQTLDRAVAVDPTSAPKLANYRAMVAFLSGRLDDAVAIAEAHAADADPEHLGNLLSNLGWFRAIDGRLAEAVALLEQSLEVATRGSALFAVLSTHCDLAIVHAWRGSHPAALDHAVQAERLLALVGDEEGDRFDVLDAFGALHLQAGEPAAALERLTEAAAIAQGGAGPYEQAFTIANFAEAQRATGDTAAALRTIDRAEEKPIVPPYWRVNLARVRAASLVDLGKHDQAIAVIESILGETRPVFELALARLVLADALRASGHKADAVAPVEEALDTFRRIGASHQVRQADLRLAVLTRRRGRPKAPAVGGLTPREQDIVKLVRDAMSNREIATSLGISERTVEKHVANALLKAGVHRRGQLASFATARGL
jgi:DNA-binding CsgD family transcriptional regulator/Tfp pilus assembly protein PilF